MLSPGLRCAGLGAFRTSHRIGEIKNVVEQCICQLLQLKAKSRMRFWLFINFICQYFSFADKQLACGYLRPVLHLDIQNFRLRENQSIRTG